MKRLSVCLFLNFLNTCTLDAAVTHLSPPVGSEWTEENVLPFDELLLSWNGARPSEGKFLFYLSVKTNEWSSWLPYASWGSEGQSSFDGTDKESFVSVYQDTLDVTDGKKATPFRVKITPEGSASVSDLHALHVYTNGDGNQEPVSSTRSPSSHIQIAGLSQIVIKHPRFLDLCSPVATAAVRRYLSGNETIDPLSFAKNVLDSGFDIFGNWVFSVAEASTHLGSDWNIWVERLNGFDHLSEYLAKGTPVIVSVLGSLKGGSMIYDEGHLMTVVGYDSSNRKVLCMDSGFTSDSETHVRYDLADFLEAWGRRKHLAYIFDKKTK